MILTVTLEILLQKEIYRRAKSINNIVTFVTEKDISRVGYEWVTTFTHA